jgi:hypothetical protein
MNSSRDAYRGCKTEKPVSLLFRLVESTLACGAAPDSNQSCKRQALRREEISPCGLYFSSLLLRTTIVTPQFNLKSRPSARQRWVFSVGTDNPVVAGMFGKSICSPEPIRTMLRSWGKFLKRTMTIAPLSGDQLLFRRARTAGQVLAQIVGVDRQSQPLSSRSEFLALGVIADQIEATFKVNLPIVAPLKAIDDGRVPPQLQSEPDKPAVVTQAAGLAPGGSMARNSFAKRWL